MAPHEFRSRNHSAHEQLYSATLSYWRQGRKKAWEGGVAKGDGGIEDTARTTQPACGRSRGV